MSLWSGFERYLPVKRLHDEHEKASVPEFERNIIL